MATEKETGMPIRETKSESIFLNNFYCCTKIKIADLLLEAATFRISQNRVQNTPNSKN